MEPSSTGNRRGEEAGIGTGVPPIHEPLFVAADVRRRNPLRTRAFRLVISAATQFMAPMLQMFRWWSFPQVGGCTNYSDWHSSAPAREQISGERPQAGEAVAGIDVVFDDVEGKVVEPAEAPDRDAEQQRGFQFQVFGEQERRGENPHDEEQDAFEFDPAGIGEVFHGVRRRRGARPPQHSSE